MKLSVPDVSALQPVDTVPIKSEEAREQARLVAALRFHWSKIELRKDRPIIFAIPNGGQRDAREGANLKVQGVLAGIPDLGIILPNGQCLWVEMKASDGRLSKSQVGVHDHMSELAHMIVTAYSAEEALNKLSRINWGF